MNVLQLLMNFIKITLGFVGLYDTTEVEAGCWYVRIGDENYIKVDSYQWNIDSEGDIVLNINNFD